MKRKKISKKKMKNHGQKENKNTKTQEVMVAKVQQNDIEECKSLKKEVDAGKDEENENLQELLKALERFKVNMPIWEVFKGSH